MKEVKNQNKVICPKCGKEATLTSRAMISVSYAILSILGLSVSVWIPIFGWVCAPIFLIIAIVFSVRAITTGGAIIKCNHCNSEYILNKDEYKEYKYKH